MDLFASYDPVCMILMIIICDLLGVYNGPGISDRLFGYYRLLVCFFFFVLLLGLAMH